MRDVSNFMAVIVCEGTDDYHFARGYLERLGVRRFEHRVNPKGEGCGSGWVRDTFAKEVQAFRSKGAYMNCLLLALIDGDGQSPAERKRQVENSSKMKELEQEPRKSYEKALIVVPMRHIEAWFEFVLEDECDEGQSYKNKYRSRKKPKKWGSMLAEKCQSVSARQLNSWPSSIKDACEELKRL